MTDSPVVVKSKNWGGLKNVFWVLIPPGLLSLSYVFTTEDALERSRQLCGIPVLFGSAPALLIPDGVTPSAWEGLSSLPMCFMVPNSREFEFMERKDSS